MSELSQAVDVRMTPLPNIRLEPNLDMQRAMLLAPAVLILGLDDKGRPHASRFAAESAASAHEAARAMEMCAVAADSEALRQLADKLPAGKIFASGKAFVPFVKQSLFDQLVGNLPDGITVPARLSKAAGDQNSRAVRRAAQGTAAGAPAPALPPKPRGSLPADFEKIKIGSVVLASIARDDGWWPAIVTEDKGDGLFVLQWQDWSDWEPFLRKREQLALLHPSYASA